jgi:L-asparaginase
VHSGGRHLLLVSTGGTIASRLTGDGTRYQPEISGADLLGNLPFVDREVTIELEEFSMKPSYMLTMAEINDLIKVVRTQARRPDVAGVVLTMGTAAIEELSYLLDLLVGDSVPVVLTGAMLNASQAGYDGLRNLQDAIRVALDPGAMGRGVLVCMAGEVHAARDVVKHHKTSVVSFTSAPNGPLALADADRVTWLRRPRGRRTLGDVVPVEPVDLIKATLGCNGRQVRSALGAGACGLVIEGFPGAGGVTVDLFEAIQDAIANGIPVLTTSRSPLGRVVPLAGGGAGPRDLAEIGCIPCGDLPAVKARLLLMCVLAVTRSIHELRAILAEVAP